MVHRNYFIAIVLSIFLVSCSGRLSKNETAFLNRLRDSIENKDNFKGTDIIDCEWSMMMPKDETFYAVYFINSSCSVCIQEFLEFSRVIERMPQIKLCFGIVNENSEDIVKYYMSMLNKKSYTIKKTYLIPVRDDFPYENSMGKSAFLCKNGAVVATL